jgi:hypothetical protein
VVLGTLSPAARRARDEALGVCLDVIKAPGAESSTVELLLKAEKIVKMSFTGSRF